MEVSSSSSSPFRSSNGCSTREEPQDDEACDTSAMDSISKLSNLPIQNHPSNSEETPSSNPNQKSTPFDDPGRSVKRSKRVSKEGSGAAASSSPSQLRGLRIAAKRRNPKGVLRGGGRRGESDFDALALPLGMSFAAVVAQVLDSKSAADDRISADNLSKVCTSAVKESLANVFEDKYDCFVRNFEKSFGSTLRTLRTINQASLDNRSDPPSNSSIEDYCSEVPQSTSDTQGHSWSECGTADCQSGVVPPTCGLDDPVALHEDIKRNLRPSSMNQELILHGQINQQLASVSKSNSGYNQPMMNAFERSVLEQARSNDLKTFEIGLIMKKLQLKESQLSLSSDSNRLEKFKLFVGISKASFTAEMYKTQLQDTRHAELLKKCIDCLVAGLLIMSSFIIYGAYTFSYQRITEAAASCLSPPKESKSWWIPKSVASLNSGLHSLRCQVEVISRMLFGVLMILSIAYLLLQRSSSSNQTMPVTFIILLLGCICGFAGKLCVDTLGGSGYTWLLYWETLCMLHFFANVYTSGLFTLLHGSVSVTQGGAKQNTKLPFWIRRLVFYAVMVLFLPILCGLMPFAGPGAWIDHFSTLAIDAPYGSFIWGRS